MSRKPLISLLVVLAACFYGVPSFASVKATTGEGHFWASENYEDLHVNADRSITIEDPYYAETFAGKQFFSGESDLGGICRMFGFGDTVAGGASPVSGAFHQTVVIDKNARFKEFRGTATSRLQLVMCKMDLHDGKTKIYPSTGLGGFENVFVGNDQYVREVSGDSDVTALCKMFGFKGRLPDEGWVRIRRPETRVRVVIGAGGEFSRLWQNAFPLIPFRCE